MERDGNKGISGGEKGKKGRGQGEEGAGTRGRRSGEKEGEDGGSLPLIYPETKNMN